MLGESSHDARVLAYAAGGAGSRHETSDVLLNEDGLRAKWRLRRAVGPAVGAARRARNVGDRPRRRLNMPRRESRASWCL